MENSSKYVGIYGVLVIGAEDNDKQVMDQIVQYIEQQGWKFSGNIAELMEHPWKTDE